MFSETVRDTAQQLYGEYVVGPPAQHSNRLRHLAWKRPISHKVRVLSATGKGTTYEKGGLSLRESIEYLWLSLARTLRTRVGDQPFGLYPLQFFESTGEGTIDKPYYPTVHFEIFDAVRGLLLLAATRKGGVYCRAGTGPYNPLIHLDQNFHFSLADDCPFNHWQVEELQKRALQHPDLTIRSAKTGFFDTIGWYNSHAETYAESIRNVLSLDQLKAFESQLPQNATILDVGCGGGRDSNYFASHGHAVIGLDLSVGLLIEATKKFPHIVCVLSNYLHSPIADQSVDGIWAHGSIHHLETKREMKRALEEFYRMLKSGGVLHVATQAKVGKNETAIAVDSLAGEARFYHYLTLSELQKLVSRVGFTIVSLKQHAETDDEVSTGRTGVEWLVLLAKKP